MNLEQLIAEIKEVDICRFCNFWDIGFVNIDEINDVVYDSFVEKIKKIVRGLVDGRHTLTVTNQEVGELKIPITQLVYEIYAFTCLNEEIFKRISFGDFLEFIKKKKKILEEQDWEVFFSENPIFPVLSEMQRDIDKVRFENVYKKIFYIRYANVNDIRGISFDEKKMWVQRFFLQEILRIYFMEVIVSYYHERMSIYEVSIVPVNWVWALNNCLYPKTDVSTTDIKYRDKYLIGNLSKHLSEESKFLSEMYSGRVDVDYEEMFDIPDKVMTQRGMLHHVDKTGKYINVIAGRRHTTDSPDNFENTVYMLGGCVFFGYAEEDRYTVSSCLQRLLNRKFENRWRVVNLATWGGNIDEEHEILKSLRYRPGDIVIISYAGLIPIGDNYQANDISYKFAEGNDNIRYFNSLVHCNCYGYEVIACNIFEKYKELFCRRFERNEYIDIFSLDNEEGYEKDHISKMYYDLKKKIPNIEDGVGAIVMNCNPFTNGHRYLIEKAAKHEKLLIVFVVEEDKSEFPFNERFELVKKGTSDIPNVMIVPSGSLMISSKTFPEYFTKKENNRIDIDPSADVFLFGRWIAPYLNIKRRYVGEEPFDLVTRKYNQVMKEILPTYGIKVEEIKRKTSDDGVVISASRVREYLHKGEWNKLKNIVPKTTYDYLQKKYR